MLTVNLLQSLYETNTNSRPTREDVLDILWKEVEKVSKTRSETMLESVEARQKEYQASIVSAANEARDHALRLEKETEHLNMLESRLLELIERVEAGTQLDSPDVWEFIPALRPEESNSKGQENNLVTERESRRKRAIDRALAFFAGDRFDPFSIAPFDSELRGLQTTKLTTGRRRTKIHGNLNALEAADVFFIATADTHDGKMRGASNKRSKVGSKSLATVIYARRRR